MSIEFQCKQCQSILRVPSEHAGKQAKCPKCEFINMIPMSTIAPVDSANAGGTGDAFTQPPSDFSQPKSQTTDGNPYQSTTTDGNPYQSTTTGGAPQYTEAHRGGWILALGIISIVGCNCCMVPGILAWILGAGDLSKIKAGRMDSSGESTTRVGMILGIVSTGLAILVGLFYFAMTALSVVVEAGGG